MISRVSGLKFVIAPISAAAPGSLYQQIVTAVRREVSEGRLLPGTALPSTRALAKDLVVSVFTINRAYEELEREGIIYRRQGLGTFVADLAADRSREAKTARARELLQDAVREATEAGLSARDVTDLFQSILRSKGQGRS